MTFLIYLRSIFCKVITYASHHSVSHSLSFFSIEREPSGDGESRKEAEENKENVRQDHCFTDALGSIYDIESWNESVISGGFTALLLIHVIFTPKLVIR